MSKNDRCRSLLNEEVTSKLITKYRNIKHVYIGFIKPAVNKSANMLKPPVVRLVKTVVSNELRECIPCIIIPIHLNTAVITLDILAQFFENMEYGIRHLVIVNRHGVLLLSTITTKPRPGIQTLYKDIAFIIKFFKNNHDYKKIRRVVRLKGIILDKIA